MNLKHIKHIKQSTNYCCGASSLAMILDISEEKAAFLSKTKLSGTSVFGTLSAIKSQNIPAKLINVDLPYECIFTDLKLLSNQYSIYVSADFVSNRGKGRNKHRNHAFAIKNETIYDPGEDFALPMNCVGHLYNKQLLIKDIILVGIEDK